MATKGAIVKTAVPLRDIVHADDSKVQESAQARRLLRRQCDTRYYLGASLIMASVVWGAGSGMEVGFLAPYLSNLDIAGITSTGVISGALAAASGLKNRP